MKQLFKAFERKEERRSDDREEEIRMIYKEVERLCKRRAGQCWHLRKRVHLLLGV